MNFDCFDFTEMRAHCLQVEVAVQGTDMVVVIMPTKMKMMMTMITKRMMMKILRVMKIPNESETNFKLFVEY